LKVLKVSRVSVQVGEPHQGNRLQVQGKTVSLLALLQ